MIPVSDVKLVGKELDYVKDCIKSGWISSAGSYVDQFEKSFSEFCDCKYGVSCSNGTAALHLALESLKIQQGDEVIIPTFTMIATCNSVIYTGAKPVLIDSEPETWNIDVNKIEEKITSRTKAIIPVHIYGHPVDMGPLIELAEKYNLFIVEDAAEAHGALYKNKKIGSLGDIGCFSFYANKIITTGEGGMLVTNNKELAERAKLLRNNAFSKPRFIHKDFGFNYKLTNLQAAIGVAQMENADKLVELRIKNASIYNSLLKNIEGITLPSEKIWAKNVYWMYGVVLDNFGVTKEQLMVKLFEKGVETRSFFIPMHQQPIYKTKKKQNFPDVIGRYPIAENLGKNGLYLPSGNSLTKEHIKQVVNSIKEVKEEIK